MATNRSDIRTNVATILGDSSNSLWSAAEINSYIQEAYDHLVYSTKAIWKRTIDTAADQAAVDDVASTATYTLPTNLHAIERVTWDDEMIPPLRPEDLEQNDPSFQTQEGTVQGWMAHGDGLRTIRKIRVPSASATDKFVVEYTARGTALSTDVVALEIPDRYAQYIRWYVLARCLEREGDGQDLGLSQHYDERYAVGLARINSRKSRMLSRRKMVMRGPSRSRRSPPRPRLPWAYGRIER